MSERAFVAACATVFVLLAGAWIDLPGPQQDELLHLPVVSPLLRANILHTEQFGDYDLPLMVMSYVGALKGWLLWLWFRVVPEGVAGYRALGILAGLVTVWLIWRFAERHYDRPVALLTTALIATDPSFVQGIRIDYGPVALAHLLRMGGLVALSGWLESGSRRALAGGMFLFGLGLWDKANFVWFLAGLGATVALLYPREALRRLRASPAVLLIGLAALLIGSAPLISYNLKHRGQTWRERGVLEVKWFKLQQAQHTFHGTFMASLTGEDHLHSSPPARDLRFPRLAHWMYRLGGQSRTILMPLLTIAVLALPVNLWLAGRLGAARRLLFPLVLAILTYAGMFFSFQGGESAHHVVMLWPFPHLFLAASLWVPAQRWPGRVPRLAASAVALAAVIVNLSVNARHLAIYTRTGGTREFSDAIYRLVPYLAENPKRKLIALDWGFSHPVAFLGSRWNLVAEDMFFALLPEEEPGYRGAQLRRLAGLMKDPNTLFLMHSPQRTVFPAAAREFFALADGGIEMRQAAFFEERSGEIVYEIYQAGRGAASPGPAEVEVTFVPGRVAPHQDYVIEAPELADSWIDIVYHVDAVSSGTATRFCRLDSAGRATLTTPATHPAATVRVTRIRRSGEAWRPARGSITVVR